MWDEAKESFWEAINGWLEKVATDLAKQGLSLAARYIQNGVKLEEIPNFSFIMVTIQALAYGLFIITFYKEILRAMKEDMTGEAQPNWLAIVGNAAISASLITFTPTIIKDVLIPISNEIVAYIADAPVKWNIKVDGIKLALSPHVALAEAGLHLLLGFLIWSIGMIALVIAQMITYAQIAIAIWLGPLLASSYQSRSEIFSVYWKEVIALVFTPVLRMALFVMVISTAGKGTLDGLLWSVGFAIVAVIGPSILKGYIHKSGASSGIVSGGKFLFYRVVLTRFRGRG